MSLIFDFGISAPIYINAACRRFVTGAGSKTAKAYHNVGGGVRGAAPPVVALGGSAIIEEAAGMRPERSDRWKRLGSPFARTAPTASGDRSPWSTSMGTSSSCRARSSSPSAAAATPRTSRSATARLCSNPYLGVSRIRERNGRVSIDGRGRVIDYAVHMRRLPAERMMDRLLESGGLTDAMLRELAQRLAEFHADSQTDRRVAEYGDGAIRYAWDENIRQWADYIGDTISAEQNRIIRAYGKAFIAREGELLRRRVAGLG